MQLEVGWPEDGCGVWIRRWDSWDRYNMGQRKERKERFARLDKARSMDERCRVIEEMGGKFYDNPRECPELAGAFMNQA